MPRTDLILVLDGEMTGNESDDELIEIGVVALAEPDWREVSYFQSIIKPTPYALGRLLSHTVVRPMLEGNGLIGDLALDRGTTPEDADQSLIDWLKPLTPSKYKTTHIPYGGSGVTWFDRKYIDKALPRFSKRITYRAFDTSVMRSTYELAGVPWTPAYESKTHRALDDARAHAEELRYVAKTLSDWHLAAETLERMKEYN